MNVIGHDPRVILLFENSLLLFGEPAWTETDTSACERQVEVLRATLAGLDSFSLSQAVAVVEIEPTDGRAWEDCSPVERNCATFQICRAIMVALHDTHTWRFHSGQVVFEKRPRQ